MDMTPTGGSHGNSHPTARIRCHAWQRGSRVAPRGACAAARTASGSPRTERVDQKAGRKPMRRWIAHKLLLASAAAVGACPSIAGEVTPERLINADKEPQNWLMNHRTYDAQRYSPLDRINKSNIANLKLAYA